MECGLHETTFLVAPDERKSGFIKCRFCNEDKVSVEDLLKLYKPDKPVETWSPDEAEEYSIDCAMTEAKRVIAQSPVPVGFIEDDITPETPRARGFSRALSTLSGAWMLPGPT